MRPAAGLKLIQDNGVAGDLATAENRLQGASFAEAAASQRAVISKLETLLSKIQEAEGIKEPNQSDTAQRIRELSKRQEQLRDATQRADLSQPESEKLVSQQADLRKQIANLQESLSNQPDVQRPLHTAQQAAEDAATNLFDQKKQPAVAKQDDVIRKLEEAAKEAEREDRRGRGRAQRRPVGRTGQGPRKGRGRATPGRPRTERRFGNFREESGRSGAARGPRRSAPGQCRAAEALAQQRPRTSRRCAASGEGRRRQHEPRRERRPSVEKANDAVERALSEALTALADARREQLLAKIAELAAAAEALDEAAKVERSVAKDAAQAAEDKGLQAGKANDLAQQQEEVGQVVKNVAEAVKHTAEKAADKLHEAEPPIGEAGKQLDRAKHQAGEPSKPAAQQAAGQAKQAAEKIADAADEVRKEMQNAADELERLAQEQLKEVEHARTDVESELAQSLQQDYGADMNQQADEAGQLAVETVPLDPNATTALRTQTPQQRAQSGRRPRQGGPRGFGRSGREPCRPPTADRPGPCQGADESPRPTTSRHAPRPATRGHAVRAEDRNPAGVEHDGRTDERRRGRHRGRRGASRRAKAVDGQIAARAAQGHPQQCPAAPTAWLRRALARVLPEPGLKNRS